MNVLGTTQISISGVYESDTTFAVLLLEKLYALLPSYGIECELNTEHTNLSMGYNGTKRLIFMAQKDSAQVAIRGAVFYNNTQSNWGSTYKFETVDSASTSTQTFSFQVSLLTFADGFGISLESSGGVEYIPEFYSFPAVNVDTNTPAYISGKSGGFWPNDVTVQSNDYRATHLGYAPQDASKCALSNVIIQKSSVLHYIMSDSYGFSHSTTTLQLGQVIEIDGVKFVCVYSNLISKY